MMPQWTTRLRIYKFVYEKGTNVALYNAEHSKRYSNFKKKVEKALNAQIKYVSAQTDMLYVLAKAKNTTAELMQQVGILIAQKKLSGDIELSAYLVWAGEQGGQAAMDKLGIQSIFGLKNQALIDYFDDYSKLIIDSVDNTTKEWIANKIQEGKNNGLNPFQIQETLVNDGKGISMIRAERIVLTETAKAMSTIELEAAKKYGIKRKIWRTSRDDRVDPICTDLEGVEVAIGEEFPGGFQGNPAHVSCRCYIEEVIPEGWILPKDYWEGE